MRNALVLLVARRLAPPLIAVVVGLLLDAQLLDGQVAAAVLRSLNS